MGLHSIAPRNGSCSNKSSKLAWYFVTSASAYCLLSTPTFIMSTVYCNGQVLLHA